MVIPLCIGGALLGFLLGLLCSRVRQGWQGRAVRQRDMDRLIAHFHALFRQIDQERQQRS
jgi:NhaP-type Na+/H+ or K+/H+ antiporter